MTNYENYLLKQAIDELLRTKVLEPSESAYSSPARPQYTNGKLDIDVDYSYINSIIVERQYPIPPVEDVITSIEESSLFSKIVIKDPYHQYSLTDESKEKTAFETGVKCVLTS